MLTKLQIQQLYKYGTFVTLGISVIVLIYPMSSNALSDKIWPATILNMAYHLMFQTTSRVPAAMYHLFLSQNSRIGNIGTLMIKIWVISLIGMTAIAAISITIIAFTDSIYR